jgi:hypothetical protein
MAKVCMTLMLMTNGADGSALHGINVLAAAVCWSKLARKPR